MGPGSLDQIATGRGFFFLSVALYRILVMEIRDLDVIVPEPKRVKFGGVEYDLPADLPMEIFLRINQAGTYKNEAGEDDSPRQIESLIDTLTNLFTWELAEQSATPEAIAGVKENVKNILMRRGARYCFTLVREIYREDDEEADEAAAEVDPTQPPVPLAAA